MPDVDVLVVGAGPAGAVAARHARQAARELDVVLLERDRAVGSPVRCAEGVGHAGLREFADPDGADWVSRRITDVIFQAPDDTEVVLADCGLGWILDRTRFDAHLAAEAAASGAQVLVGAEATGMSRNGDGRWHVRVKERGRDELYRTRIAIGPDDDARAVKLVPPALLHAHVPTSITVARHAGRFGADEHLRTGRCCFGREMRVEPRSVENPAEAAVGEHYLGVIGRLENDVGDPPGYPVSAVGIGELAQTGVADAFGTAHGGPDRPVAFEQHDVELAGRLLRVSGGNRPGRPGAHYQDVDVRHERRGLGIGGWGRSEEHTSELQSRYVIS